jgi:glycosyltransferase involved in cell wall biosynthesis
VTIASLSSVDSKYLAWLYSGIRCSDCNVYMDGYLISDMRMLHILPSYLPAVRYGGPTVSVHGLCRALAARGHSVEVFTTNINGTENSQVPLGVPVLLDGVIIRYYESTFLRRLFWSARLGKALKENVNRFDIVHLHSVFLWPTWAAARNARRSGVPYVISPRGMLVKELIRRRSRLVKSAWLQFVEKKNLERASAIHLTSELEAKELGRFSWHLPYVGIIPNGVEDMSAFSSMDISDDVAAVTKQKPFVLFLGRVSWKKGLDRLLRAFALAKLAGLVIVGPDDEQIVPSLIKLARNLGIADRVHFLPRTVLGADKGHLYASAQQFILPSLSENFGNTVLEAMQHGLPVIVTPEVGAANIVREASAGLIVPGDPWSLSIAMRQLAETESMARAMGRAGRQHVLEHYSWARIAAEMESLYDKLKTIQ